MNANFFRTLLTWGAIIVTMGSTILGCTTDAVTGNISCAASWLSPQLAGIAATVMLVINQLLKAFQGGTPGAGLVSPTVVVSASGAAGTVTQTQVETGPKK
jgi:hypothetical protein